MGRGFGNQEIINGKIKGMEWAFSISYLKFAKQFESTNVEAARTLMTMLTLCPKNTLNLSGFDRSR